MAKTDPKEPRYRSFRVTAYLVFIAITTVFCWMTAAGVWRSVAKMSPARAPAQDAARTLPECLDQLQALHDELDRERRAFLEKPLARRVDQDWTRFRTDWVARFRVAEAGCAVDARDRGRLKQAFRRLDRLQDLYTTHAVQFAGEIGGAVDSFRQSLADARKSAVK